MRRPLIEPMSRAIDEERYRAGALSTLAPHLPETLKEEVLSEALTAARAFDDGYARAQVLIEMTPHLPEVFHSIQEMGTWQF